MADNREVVNNHMRAWSSGDVEGIVACFTEECVFQDLALQATFEGHAGLREFAAAVYAATPDFPWTPTGMVAAGDSVCTEWRFTLTQTGDFPGIPLPASPPRSPASPWTSSRAGKIHRHRDY
jgi:steroid delta-isomerase-like uncharacterized protein